MKRLRSALSAVALLLAACHTSGGPGQVSAGTNTPGTQPAITATDLRQRLFLIADDSTLGRETGSEGAFTTSAYIAAEFQRLGLEPAGDQGTYFQAVPFWDVRVDPGSQLTSSTGATLRLVSDFLPASFSAPPRVFDRTAIVYAGSADDTAQVMSPTGVAGKFVVIDVPPGVDRRAVLAQNPGCHGEHREHQVAQRGVQCVVVKASHAS